MKSQKDQSGYFVSVVPFINKLNNLWCCTVVDNEGGYRFLSIETAKSLFPLWDGNAGFQLLGLLDERPVNSDDHETNAINDDVLYLDDMKKVDRLAFASGNCQDEYFASIMEAMLPKINKAEHEYPTNGYAKPTWWID